MILKCDKSYRKLRKKRGNFCLVIGFSQGAGLAAWILLEQQERGKIEGQEFRFALCVDRIYPA